MKKVMRKLKILIKRLIVKIFSVLIVESLEEQFSLAYKEFEKEISLTIQNMSSSLSKSKVKIARSSNVGKQQDIYSQKYKLYEDFTKELGDTFLAKVDKIILENCDEVLPNSVRLIQKQLTIIFQSQLQVAKDGEKRYLLSIGKSKDEKSSIIPIEGLFNNNNSKYVQLLESHIGQFNLRKYREKREHNRQHRLEITKELIKYGLTGGGIIIVGKWLLTGIGLIK